PDVISRVLRSKFTPSAVRKLEQDSKMEKRNNPDCQRLQRLPCPDSTEETETGLVPSSGNIVASQLPAKQNVTPALQEQPGAKAETDMRDDIEMEEEWDGAILTEEELEKIAQTLKEKPSL
ncbi:hypothetical protein M9458_017607, partial [Cirrhinus mrigala]